MIDGQRRQMVDTIVCAVIKEHLMPLPTVNKDNRDQFNLFHSINAHIVYLFMCIVCMANNIFPFMAFIKAALNRCAFVYIGHL